MDNRTDFSSENTTLTTSAVCRRCLFHPASPRIAGYCSWDCYEADDDAAELTAADTLEAEKAARRAPPCPVLEPDGEGTVSRIRYASVGTLMPPHSGSGRPFA
jgi:hypothetical protein